MPSRSFFTEDDGELTFRKRKKAPGADEFDITPMIDCTFLLLIFFMVASTMQGGSSVDLPVATYTEGVDVMRGALLVTIRAAKSSNDSPIILIGDGAGEETNPEGLRRAAEAAMRSGKSKVVLKVEGDVPHGVVEEAAQAVKQVEGIEFFIGVREN